LASGDSTEVGVVNPKFFYRYGRELHLTRLRVHNWNVLLEKLPSSNLDIYTLFGPFDLLCKNYFAKNDYQLSHLLSDYGIPESFLLEPTPFVVESIDRFENVTLDWQAEVDLELFAIENLQYLDEIQRDWNSVPSDVRHKLIESRVILPNPIIRGSQQEDKRIRAFVFIKLPVITPTDLKLHKMILEARIFNHWTDSIVGLYWSSCHEQYHCVVEICAADWSGLKKFVMDDCQSVQEIMMETATHIVIYPVTNRVVPASEILRGVPVTPKAAPKLTLEEILAKKEGLQIEFKQTLRCDTRNNQVNKQLEKSVAKTIAAFMNTDGGILVIGATDDRNIFGLEADIQTLKRKNRDGFEQDFLRVIKEYLGEIIATKVNYIIERREDKLICIVYVDGSPVPSSRPVYLTDVSKDSKPKEFWVRAGSSTIQLDIEEADKYIRDRWPEYKGR